MCIQNRSVFLFHGPTLSTVKILEPSMNLSKNIIPKGLYSVFLFISLEK